MARFDLLYEQAFTSTDTITVTHSLNRYVFNVRVIITGDPRLSQRELVQDILLDVTTPLDKCVVLLTGDYTGTIQIIAEDTIQSPYYAVADKLQSQIGSARFPFTLVMNGTMSNNDWISYSNLVESPQRFPTNSRLAELAWDNTRTSVDFDIEFNRYLEDGTPYAGNPFYTYEVRDVDYGGMEVGLDFDFLAGDYIRLQYKDKGKNCADLVVVLWCYKTAD